MNNSSFTFHMPTKLYVGENAVLKNADALVLGKRAFVVCGRNSAALSGALDDITAVLSAKNVCFSVYDKIENNPSLGCVFKAGTAAREFGADFIIAAGGGSPLDAAKAAAVYAANDIEPMAIYDGGFLNTPLPIAAIPTTAGTGSEVTPYSILTLDSEKTKRSFTCADCFPKAAFLDGRYTLKLPVQVARNTAIDAMSHAIEGYLTNRARPSSDYIALEALGIIAKHLPRLESGKFDIDMCTELLWAASLAGTVISQTGTTVVHSMGYQLTYNRAVPHGMANGLLMGEFLKRCAACVPQRVQKLLSALGMKSVQELDAILKRLIVCGEVFGADEISQWAKISAKAKNINSAPFYADENVEKEIFINSLLK